MRAWHIAFICQRIFSISLSFSSSRLVFPGNRYWGCPGQCRVLVQIRCNLWPIYPLSMQFFLETKIGWAPPHNANLDDYRFAGRWRDVEKRVHLHPGESGCSILRSLRICWTSGSAWFNWKLTSLSVASRCSHLSWPLWFLATFSHFWRLLAIFGDF